ncbi:TPA: chromosome segregation protein SMC [Bacillus cereus]|uniref:chromosome segregation protein SMC n=1 Tax=Bacillus sp. BS98 TaxID=2608254 RepID=UPI00122F11BB|nr:chromosome segregation protein SMC [Bacillus sp. BS98]HDR7980574.1 chromosome segregation protein SMC [Bacillus cereus]QEQ16299.1 chromosome segregation protein SMC [Bacillus sp. BS98]HDR8058525.1 chromosome segregation protein SMC [Bacillus cereus]HDR8219339.1 chromosome segregation protein SMC [Bacillus cereus]HDR8232970.1 chromosome segregation protein SMC [Bacillus cereus]
MTENEKKLLEQIYAKVCEMEKKVNSIGDDLDELSGKETSTSVESKLGDLKNVHKGIQATFEQGFADVHKGLEEIKENRSIAKEWQKQKGQLN